MISTILLILIYVSFISLGLPDSLAGAAWPMMHLDLGADLALLGSVTFTVSIGTIISSLSYAKVSRFVKPGKINCFSTILTGLCLLLMSRVTSIWMLYPIALIQGIGAGAVDSSLNNYVAIHYKARHMNFLHACWGVGTIFGPSLLSVLFMNGRSWRNAYVSVSALQLAIGAVLLLTIGLWKKAEIRRTEATGEEEKPQTHSLRKVIGLKGVRISMFSTFLYCTIEAVTFIWTASFINVSRGFSESDAAFAVSMLYWGITIGRIASGFVSEKLGDDRMVILGLIFTMLGGIPFLFSHDWIVLIVSAFLIGFGFGPVFPCILHQTPSHFGIENSSAVMGLLMSGAYVGSAVMPLLFGLGTKLLTPSYLPWTVVIFTGLQMLAWKMRKDTFRDR